MISNAKSKRHSLRFAFLSLSSLATPSQKKAGRFARLFGCNAVDLYQ
jgi:hypothetical protein